MTRWLAAGLALALVALACGKYGPPERPPRGAQPAEVEAEEETEEETEDEKREPPTP